LVCSAARLVVLPGFDSIGPPHFVPRIFIALMLYHIEAIGLTDAKRRVSDA
jgi:hypothetical protein